MKLSLELFLFLSVKIECAAKSAYPQDIFIKIVNSRQLFTPVPD